MIKLTQREKDLGYCETAQTYCSMAEEMYQQGKADGAREYCYTDRHAYEIIEVKDERHITVRAYDCRRTDNNGMSECQDYEYVSNPDGAICHLFLTQKGVWRERYGNRKLGCNRWGIGHAEEYYDYSF